MGGEETEANSAALQPFTTRQLGSGFSTQPTQMVLKLGTCSGWEQNVSFYRSNSWSKRLDAAQPALICWMLSVNFQWRPAVKAEAQPSSSSSRMT